MGIRTWLGLKNFEPPNQTPPADWRPPRKTCMIAATPRSGSNLLRAAMYETHCVGYPDEFFNAGITRRTFPDLKAVGKFQANRARSEGTTANGVTAIKFLPDQFRQATRNLRLASWFSDPRWIWLRRRDRLGQAVSLEIATQTRAWVSFREEEREPVYSTASIRRRIREIDRGESFWASCFEANRIEPLVLWYEDLAADPAAAARSVADFMGETAPVVPPNTVPNPLIGIQVQRNARSAEWVDRFRAYESERRPPFWRRLAGRVRN